MELSYKLEKFEGPLDLLLHLIEKNKINIYDIPIAEITDQYLEYVSCMEEESLDVVSEFLVMAATLLDIKARMLLPREVSEEGEEEDFPYEGNIMEKLGRLGTLGQIIQWINWFKEAVSRILERRRDTRVDKIAEMVREYVMEHYKERITLGQAAEALNISQGYLSTAFKKQSGESFTNYVSAIKIEKAKELIASHQYMMYEVSDLLGFDTPFYFSKVFKKVTGMSPKEYEAQCLKQKNL